MFDEAELERHLDNRGLANRLIRGASRAVTRPRHVYPVGLLFGLGFDTATEVGLLVLAGGAAVSMAWYAVLTLPVIFAAGMCLLDTADGLLMRHAYGWANHRPVRKVSYNVAVTGLSVTVASSSGPSSCCRSSPTGSPSVRVRWPPSPASTWATSASW